MLAKTHLGFAKGPVFVAHQTQHRQQLRLRELVFAETAAVGRQDPLGHLQGHAGKGQESDFGHRPSCFLRKHSLPPGVENSNLKLCRGCQQSHIESLHDLSEHHGDQIKLFALDVTDESAAASAVKAAIGTFDSLEVVINNAGYGNLSSVEDTPMSDFRAQIETNLFGTIIVTK